MHQKEKTKLTQERLKGYDDKKYNRKTKKVQENLNIDKKVLVLAERIRKNKLQANSNISCFNKENIIFVRKKQKIDKIQHYWLNDKKKKKRNREKIPKDWIICCKQ